MEEKQPLSFQDVLKDTYFSNVDITFKKMSDFCKEPSHSIRFIPFDNSIIQELNTHFPVLDIKGALGARFDKINRLAITESLYSEIDKLLNVRYAILEKHQTQIALLVSFCIPNKDRPKFHHAGKSSKIQSELSRLKNLLQEQVEVELDYTDPDNENSGDNAVKRERVSVSHPKYIINKIIVELKDDDKKKETIQMNIYDTDEHGLLWDKAKMDIFFMETFEKALDKLNVASEYKKVNTNHLFCQQFFNFINTQTAFSTNHGYSERQILLLFTKVYKLTGHLFPTLTKIKSKTDEFEIEIVKKWLKP